MTSEEMERAIEFILDSQAKSERRLDRLERVVGLAIRAGLRTRRETREQLRALVDSQVRLTDAQTRTDNRINALVGVMERHITETHGGQP